MMIRQFLLRSRFSASCWAYCVLLVCLSVQYSRLHLSVTRWFAEVYNLLVASFNSGPGESYVTEIRTKMLSLPKFLVFLCALRVLSSFFLATLLLDWRSFECETLVEGWALVARVEGASQRVQEDTLHVVKLVLNLFFRIVVSTSRSLAHVPMLVEHSCKVGGIPPFPDGFRYSLLAYLVASVSVSVLSAYLTSRKMSSKIMVKEAVEAELRKQLILGEEGAPRLNLPLIRHTLISELKLIHADMYLYSLGYSLTSESLTALIEFLPTLLLIPAISRRDITVGGRAAIIRCFNTVTSGVTCLFSSWDDISELCAAVRRLLALEDSLLRGRAEPHSLLHQP